MREDKIISSIPPPYDVIGDVHGCLPELISLFEEMGYKKEEDIFVHPKGRIPIFLGDITDRGPDSVNTIKLVMKMVKKGKALYVVGNHCDKLYRWMKGRRVKVKWGMETTISEIERMPPDEKEKLFYDFINLIENSPPYLILDKGKLIVAHAGIREDMIGRYDEDVKRFVLYGDITGEFDEYGLPIRRDWAKKYTGEAFIVYGHTPVEYPVFRYNTINIDGGCAMGGLLCSLHYPEMEITTVPARKTYYTSPKNRRKLNPSPYKV